MKLNPHSVPKKLERKLLKIGGIGACCPGGVEPQLELLLKNGALIGGKVVRVKGKQSYCHANVATHFLYSAMLRGNRTPCTGYALSDDGIWRQHSWLVDGDKIYETTAMCKKYFGVILEGQALTRFILGELFRFDRENHEVQLAFEGSHS